MRTSPIVALLVVAIVAGLTSCASASSTSADRPRSGCYSYAISADRVLYPAGEPVHLIVEARNVTSHTCLGHVCGGITAWIDIRDDHGHQVFRTNPSGILCQRPVRPSPVVGPGRSTLWESYIWPSEDGGTPSPGRYTAEWHWLEDVDIHSPAFTVVQA